MKFPSKPIQVVARGKHLDKDTYELCVHRYHDASKVIVLNKGYERMAVLTCCVTKSGLLEDEILISHSSTGKDKVMASDLSQSVANEVAGKLRNSNKGKIIKVVKQ